MTAARAASHLVPPEGTSPGSLDIELDLRRRLQAG
jgi:hypothetical protein